MTPNLVNRRRHLMDWGEELEARTPGGSSSSQSRGLVMTLLAVDKRKVFLYFLTFGDVFLANETSSGIVGSLFSNGSILLFDKRWIHEVICRHLAVDDTIPFLFSKFSVCLRCVGFGVSPLRRDGDPSVESCGIV